MKDIDPAAMPEMPENGDPMGGGRGGFGGMDSGDVKPQYIDDDPDSYASFAGRAFRDS